MLFEIIKDAAPIEKTSFYPRSREMQRMLEGKEVILR
jgi:hypothetical protein